MMTIVSPPTAWLPALAALFYATASTLGGATLPAGFSEQEVGSLWTEPVGVAFDSHPQGSNRTYVWERAGRVWILENGVNSWTPLLDIRDEVGAWRDYGMLGFTLDPNFQENGYIYVSYVVDRHHLLHAGTPDYDPTANEYLAATIGRVTRYTARASDGFRTVDPASRRVLVGETVATGIPILHGSHAPGTLAFGLDGTLLVASGDAASWEEMDDGGSDGNSYAPQGLADGIIQSKEDVGAFRAQLVDSLSGKILRIDPSSGDGIPSNPFYDPARPRAPKSRVWALGLRNPYRMTVRPDTGSHLPADADPGLIVLGDVGWNTFEEVHVIKSAGQNCGWPLFEGLTPQPTYQDSPAENLDAPNPLGGYFRFKDLLVQETLGSPSWPNPREPSQQVPATIARFMHKRPVIDVGRDVALVGPARTGTFSGDTATETKIGAPGSPVAGPQYLANTSTGGVFYSGLDFPANYRGTYFHADYGQGWIKNIVFDANHRPVEVSHFATGIRPVCLATHPTDGGLYYVDMTIPAVRKIVYAPGGNRPPIARASADLMFGSSPLTVQFSSAGSSDPDGQVLTYQWEFGDGATSTSANPAYTFVATGARRYDVRLTVADGAGATAQVSFAVFVNHTLPLVEMLSPIDGTKYPLSGDTDYRLSRRVTETPGHPTTTTWSVFLRHNNHEHGEPPINGSEAIATLSPVYSPTEESSYRIVLTVTDDLGAVVQREARLFPNASNVAPQIGWSTPSRSRSIDGGVAILDGAATAADPDSTGIESGELRVECSTAEALSIVPEGDGPGQVNLSGTSVLFGGVNVGRVTISGSSLSVAFNDAATPAAARAILRRVAANFTTTGTHTVTASLQDGDGGTSPPALLRVNVSTNQPPMIVLTSPINGASFVAPASIALTANATDADGNVAKVEFFSGATKVGEATSAPFGFGWSSVSAGSYSLTARATDNSGATADSLAVVITVTSPNQPPVVVLTAPLNGATFVPPANLTLAASAGDADGEIKKVEFFSGALKLGVSRIPPYTLLWGNVPAGTYSLTARATDNQNAATTSAAATITVAPPGGLLPPWQSRDIGPVALAGSAAFAGGRFTVTASGRDISLNADQFRYVWQPWAGDGDIVCRVDSISYVSPGTIAGVMFREALGPKSRHVMVDLTAGAGAMMRHRVQAAGPTAEVNGPDEIAPYWLKLTRRGALFSGWISGDGLNWSLVGTLTLSLPEQCLVGLVTCAANGLINDPLAATTVTFSNVSVRAPENEHPAVVLTSPVSGTMFNPPPSVLIEALASDPRGPIEKLEFFDDATKIGEIATPPFALSWEGIATGAYTLRAKATGPAGSVATSEPVQFTVRESAISLPAPWQHQDIGAVARAGNATAAANAFTVSSSGAAAPASADQLHYVWQQWNGDGTIVARVVSIGNTNAQAFAGVMFREALSPDARNVLLSVRAGVSTAFQWRGRSGRLSKIVAGPEVAAPRWLKLVRKGTRFSGFISADGIIWRRVGRQTVAIPEACFVGLAVCAANEAAVTNGVFDRIQVSAP